MILVLSLIASSWAGGVLVRPSPAEPVPKECRQSTAIVPGEKAPAAAFTPDGFVVCSGIIEPTSSMAYLLAMEKYAIAVEKLHRIDTEILTAERDWYKAKLENQTKEPTFWKRSETQRWIGRVEVLTICAILAASAASVYAATNGSVK
tara:strand:+ start:460 stop:903 length:444 start_codon:yes stop_codon:yes gene_type:complete